MVMALLSGPGSMISRFTCGTFSPSSFNGTMLTSSTPTTECGLPTEMCATGRSGLVPSEFQLAGSSSEPIRPMSTEALMVVASSGCTSTRRGPASVATMYSTFPVCPYNMYAACAKQRMPLPLISASEPSLLYKRIVKFESSILLNNNKPSAPMPVVRLHNVRALAGQSEICSAGTSNTKKSFPSPECLVRVTARDDMYMYF